MVKAIWYSWKHGITNLIKWAPTIWDDRDWDYDFFYMLMLKKLEFMENFYRNHGHCVGNEDVANQIKECCELIKILLEDDYNKEEFDKHNQKWGRFTEKDKEAQEEFHLCIEKENELRQKDREELFGIIKENIDSWWD